MLKRLKEIGISVKYSILHSDMGFDTRAFRRYCWGNRITPNFKENPRNRQKTKRGKKRFFDAEKYKNRFKIEQMFAWLDKFRRIQTRYEREPIYFNGLLLIAYAMVNLRQ